MLAGTVRAGVYVERRLAVPRGGDRVLTDGLTT